MNQQNPNLLPVKLILLLVSTLTVMSGATISPSLPAMREHFSTVENADYWVKLILTVPALFIVLGAPLAGLTIDRLGRKSMLIASTLLYGIAGSSGFFLNSLVHILIGRAFLGLGVAGVMTSVTTLIADYYSGQARATFMGLQAAFMAFGGVIFLTVGGVLSDFSWRFPFLIYLSALFLLPGLFLWLWEPQRLSPTLPQDVKSSQLKTPLNLLGFVYGTAVLMQVIFYLIPVQLPFYLKTLTPVSATQSGLAIGLCNLFSAIASLLYGRLKARLSFINILQISFVGIALGYGLIGTAKTYPEVLLGLAVSGIGLGFMMPNLTVWLTSETPESIRGRVLGGLTTFFFLGQFLSPILTQPAIQLLNLGKTYSLAGGLMFLLAGISFVFTRLIAPKPTA